METFIKIVKKLFSIGVDSADYSKGDEFADVIFNFITDNKLFNIGDNVDNWYNIDFGLVYNPEECILIQNDITKNKGYIVSEVSNESIIKMFEHNVTESKKEYDKALAKQNKMVEILKKEFSNGKD